MICNVINDFFFWSELTCIIYNKFFLPFAFDQDIADTEEKYMHELYL